MKKIALLLIIALLAVFPAFGESAPATTHLLEGVVVEIVAGESLLIETANQGEILANTDDDTAWELNYGLAAGDYVYIEYDGKMTRSIPAQIYATRVYSQRVEGTIVEVYSDANAMLIRTEDSGEVYVHLPEDLQGKTIDGDSAVVYFNGIMTLSMPGQINAGKVVFQYAVQGEVTKIFEDTLLIDDGSNAVHVNFAVGTLPEQLSVGDIVRVIYDGKMTYSLPPQIYAQEIISITR